MIKLPDAILFTATVEPSVSEVVKSDPQERLNEYLDSLAFYAEKTELPIYVLENSGYPLELDVRFCELKARYKIQLLELKPESNQSRGKGYQEFAMIDKAIGILGNRLKRFAKVTGRYKVLNFQRLVTGRKPLQMDLHKRKKIGITSFFVVDTSFYRKHLMGCFREVHDGEERYIEHVVYDTIIRRELQHDVEMFRENPELVGTSGSYGGPLHRHPMKMALRNAERRALRVLGRNEFPWEY